MPSSALAPSRLHRIQGVAGLLLLLTLALPWLRRESGDRVETVPGWRLPGGSDLPGGDLVPTFLAVLVLLAVGVVAVSALVSWWRRSVGAALLAGLAALMTIFLTVGASAPRGLGQTGVVQEVHLGLMAAVFLCAVVLVSCLALLKSFTPPRN